MPNGGWHYWHPFGTGLVDVGVVRGREVALPPHFHEEDQATFVVRGRRHFVIGGRLVDVSPGEGLHIPSGTPHRSLSGESDVIAINIYAGPGTYAIPDLIAALSDYWRITGRIGWADLAAILAEYRSVATPIPRGAAPERECPESWETVEQAARLAGMSREGFSRRFSRLYGMPPHKFQLMEKLNEARRLLRGGERIAVVAADTGFADQSHLGRWFLRAFGVTPGAYRSDRPVTSVL